VAEGILRGLQSLSSLEPALTRVLIESMDIDPRTNYVGDNATPAWRGSEDTPLPGFSRSSLIDRIAGTFAQEGAMAQVCPGMLSRSFFPRLSTRSPGCAERTSRDSYGCVQPQASVWW
jgi:hypothetical protein